MALDRNQDRARGCVLSCRTGESQEYETIRILIVDDHTLLRSGIKLALQRMRGRVVARPATGWKASSAPNNSSRTWCCSICTCPDQRLEALRVLVEDVPETQVVMLTVSEDAEDLRKRCAPERAATC